MNVLDTGVLFSLQKKKNERKLNIINKAVIKLVFYDPAQSFGFSQ